jgi:hypothetical protein
VEREAEHLKWVNAIKTGVAAGLVPDGMDVPAFLAQWARKLDDLIQPAIQYVLPPPPPEPDVVSKGDDDHDAANARIGRSIIG